MKKFLLIAAAVATFTFTSCSKDDDKVEDKVETAEEKAKKAAAEADLKAKEVLKGNWKLIKIEGNDVTKFCVANSTLELGAEELVLKKFTPIDPATMAECTEDPVQTLPYTASATEIIVLGGAKKYTYSINDAKDELTVTMDEKKHMFKKQ